MAEPMGKFFGKHIYKASDAEELGGYQTILFTGQAEGAIPNGTRVEKCNTETSDSLFNGAQGTVYSSIATGDTKIPFLYYVEFDKFSFPVLITSKRIRAL